MMQPTLDPAQEKRIDAVHSGFLYQHLYAVACLLSAQEIGADFVLIERDEDVEIVTPTDRIYIQVKTRNKPLIPSDINGAIERFQLLREEHAAGRRSGNAKFIILANQAPGPLLTHRIAEGTLGDVVYSCPGSNVPEELQSLPPAWNTLEQAAEWCIAKAEALPHATISADSLVWKLAGLVLAAAAGNHPIEDHSFNVQQLPQLFEQLLIQLQQFPAPPIPYRPQQNEPAIDTTQLIRIISGFSGAGKTSWASQAATHSSKTWLYFDCADIPSEAFAVSLVRELAGKFNENIQDVRKEILVPGATGLESLRVLDTYLKGQGLEPVVVIDNAHKVEADSMRRAFEGLTSLRFVLLCQPIGSTREIEAITGIAIEHLNGWGLDEIAAACSAIGATGSAAVFGRLQLLTGGSPLFVESAARIAAREHGGDLEAFCTSIEQLSQTAETAQDIILEKVFDALPERTKNAVAALSLSDISLKQNEIHVLLNETFSINTVVCTGIIRDLRRAGVVEAFGSNGIKIHDAMRIFGFRHLQALGDKVSQQSKASLREILYRSILGPRDTSRFALYTRMLVETREIKVLVDLIGEEMFHELGIAPSIWQSLELLIQDPSVSPKDKVWAYDGLIFSGFKRGIEDNQQARLDSMESLIREHNLGDQERMTFIMKRMTFESASGNQNAVQRAREAMEELLPGKPKHYVVFQYNAACALFALKQYDEAESQAREVVQKYYETIGITPEQVIGLNQEALSKLVNRPHVTEDDKKHLADALELLAIVTKKLGRTEMLARIHAIKFYSLVGALDSIVRVGQDIADDFVFINDFEEARTVLEKYVLPTVLQAKMFDRIVAVRSQYAVVLAYCLEIDAAEAEMAKLEPYAPSFSDQQKQEIADQKALIAKQRIKPVLSRRKLESLNRIKLLKMIFQNNRP